MKRQVFLIFLAIVLVGITVWFVSPDDTTKLIEMASTETEHQRDAELNQADRDSAAEEVRAFATKISNVEKTVESNFQRNQQAREQLRSEFDESMTSVQEAMHELSNQQSVDNLYIAIEQLIVRVDRLESMQLQESVAEVSQSQAPIIWRTSIDSTQSLESEYPLHETDQELIPASYANVDIRESANDTPESNSPAYTIPPTTTLLNGVALTALVGRIPINGRLEDPWRFKLITSMDNLAANGHRIPELAGMLWSGTARGDLTLSCISGNVDTATFIFRDGTIQTVRKDASAENLGGGLGWISDDRGNPCILGEVKSNALRSLARSTTLSTLGATASALADAQATTSLNSSGENVAQSITGDIDNFVLGRAVEEAISESNRWMQSRYQNAFDAVYLPAGHPVAIHIEHTIEINQDPQGRKVQYLDNSQSESSRLGGLD